MCSSKSKMMKDIRLCPSTIFKVILYSKLCCIVLFWEIFELLPIDVKQPWHTKQLPLSTNLFRVICKERSINQQADSGLALTH
jgi:hypothetical protein